jgi:lipopolysaccharide export system ATP-binding protein
VVNGVSVTINGGEIIGLLGPNGAGKTTTFYIIMGMVSADSGKIFLNDGDIGNLPMFMRARAGIGYLPQESSVFKKLTVEENLIAIGEYLPLSAAERRSAVDEMLQWMNLIPLARQKAYTLSGGERRRLEIARTLIRGPKFLLMDEPFGGVDPISISALQDIVVSLKEKNIGILITDHNVRETLRIVDRAYLIHGGKILCHGPREVLLNDENSRKLYLGENFDM